MTNTILLLILILSIQCHPEGYRLQEAECETSYNDCIHQVYCFGGAIMCERINKIEKKDDRSWCLVEKRCRKVLAEFKHNKKVGDRLLVAVMIFIACMPFIAIFCEICSKI